MNVTNILVYGERLGDLLAAREVVTAFGAGGHPADDKSPDLRALFRAINRASAEELLERADSAHPFNVNRYDDLVDLAYLRVLTEILAVWGDPHSLQAHPALAGRPASSGHSGASASEV